MKYCGFTVSFRQWLRLLFTRSYISWDEGSGDYTVKLTCKKVGGQIYILDEEVFDR